MTTERFLLFLGSFWLVYTAAILATWALFVAACLKYLFWQKPIEIDTSKLDRIEEKIIHAARKEARDELIRRGH